MSKAEARARREIMVLQRQSEDAMQDAEVDAARLRSRLRAAFLGEASGHEQQKREEELNIQIAAERELRLQQSEEAIAEAQARARREVFVLREQTREAMEEADAEAARLRSRLRAAFLAEPKLKEAAASTQEALGAAREEMESVKAALAKAVAASTKTSDHSTLALAHVETPPKACTQAEQGTKTMTGTHTTDLDNDSDDLDVPLFMFKKRSDQLEGPKLEDAAASNLAAQVESKKAAFAEAVTTSVESTLASGQTPMSPDQEAKQQSKIAREQELRLEQAETALAEAQAHAQRDMAVLQEQSQRQEEELQRACARADAAEEAYTNLKVAVHERELSQVRIL